MTKKAEKNTKKARPAEAPIKDLDSPEKEAQGVRGGETKKKSGAGKVTLNDMHFTHYN